MKAKNDLSKEEMARLTMECDGWFLLLTFRFCNDLVGALTNKLLLSRSQNNVNKSRI